VVDGEPRAESQNGGLGEQPCEARGGTVRRLASFCADNIARRSLCHLEVRPGARPIVLAPSANLVTASPN
jgi:hypothetical protein